MKFSLELKILYILYNILYICNLKTVKSSKHWHFWRNRLFLLTKNALLERGPKNSGMGWGFFELMSSLIWKYVNIVNITFSKCLSITTLGLPPWAHRVASWHQPSEKARCWVVYVPGEPNRHVWVSFCRAGKMAVLCSFF